MVSGRGCSSPSTRTATPFLCGDLDGDDLVGEAPGRLRRGPALLVRSSANASCSSREIAVLLGDVLGGLAHALEREQRRHLRVQEAPAERGVVHRAVAARERRGRLRHHQRRARHRLDAAGDEEVAVADGDRARGRDDGLEPRAAQAVHRDAGDRLRQPRQQRRHARDVAVVLAGLVGAAEEDVVDLARARRRRARRPPRSRAPRDRRGARRRARRRSGRSACARPRG